VVLPNVLAVPVVRPELSRKVVCCAKAGSAASTTAAAIAAAGGHVICVLMLFMTLTRNCQQWDKSSHYLSAYQMMRPKGRDRLACLSAELVPAAAQTENCHLA
jgi:hypothetical protein